MPNLTVNGVTYNFPDPGTPPGWGENTTAWAEAVTEVLNFLVSPGDLVNITASINNNVSSPTNVTGCVFSSVQTRAANVTYQVVRSVTGTDISETGTLLLHFDPSLGWSLTRSYTGGNAGVDFSVTPTGQVQYTSTDLVGTSYEGLMKFNAKTLPQV